MEVQLQLVSLAIYLCIFKKNLSITSKWHQTNFKN